MQRLQVTVGDSFRLRLLIEQFGLQAYDEIAVRIKWSEAFVQYLGPDVDADQNVSVEAPPPVGDLASLVVNWNPGGIPQGNRIVDLEFRAMTPTDPVQYPDGVLFPIETITGSGPGLPLGDGVEIGADDPHTLEGKYPSVRNVTGIEVEENPPPEYEGVRLVILAAGIDPTP